MSLFSRTPKQGVIQTPQPARSPEFSGLHTPEPATESATPIIDLEALLLPAKQYSDAWSAISLVVEGTDFAPEANALVLDYGNVPKDAVAFRKGTARYERNSMLQAVLSARISSDRSLDCTPYVYSANLYTPATDECSASHQRLMQKIHRTACTLENVYAEINASMSKVIKECLVHIQAGNIDAVLDDLRTACLDPEYQSVLEMIAQDIHDPKRGEIPSAIARSMTDIDNTSTREVFAESLSHQDGEFDEQVGILAFAIKALSRGGIDADIPTLVTSIPTEEWPQALLEAYSLFKARRAQDITVELHKITEPFYIHTRRKPSVDDLKQVERAQNAILTEVVSRPGAKIPSKNLTNIPDDSLRLKPPEAITPRHSMITKLAVQIDQQGRHAIISELEEDEVITSLVDKFVESEKLRGPQKDIVSRDVKKMLTALKLNPTRNFGVTKLSDVRPFKDERGRVYAVWRLNPAHYNGLSVGEICKDTRIIYGLGPEGAVNIIGIYRHDDYENAISLLR